MSTFSGSDIQQLRSLAERFDVYAGKLREIVSSSTWALMVAEWTGADIDRVRSAWNRASKPHLRELARDLAETAMLLRRQAMEQERVSAATTGSTWAAGSEEYAGRVPPLDEPRAGPRDLRGLIAGVKDFQGGDLFSVTEIVGPDGATRLIVTIPGTHGDLFDPLGLSGRGSWWQTGGWASDPAVWLDQHSEVEEQIMAALRDRMAAYPDAEIMIVGHSQGGMLAQLIANSGEFNVREVVTVGSPRMTTDNGFGGANVTRLEHNSDWIVGGTDLGAVLRDGLTGRANRSRGSGGDDITFRGGSYLEGLPGDGNAHDVGIGDYDWLADRFQESDDPHLAAVRDRQRLFLGGTTVGVGYVRVP